MFIFFIAVMALTACDETPQRVLPKGKKMIIADRPFPQEKEAPIEIPPAPAPYTGPQKFCFEMELGNNVSEMTRMQFIVDDNDSVQGNLDYSFAERSPIHGSITGVKIGKILELNYEYTDSSVRKCEQITLKMENDKIYKKIGSMVDEGGCMVLENPRLSTLQLFLMKVNCK